MPLEYYGHQVSCPEALQADIGGEVGALEVSRDGKQSVMKCISGSPIFCLPSSIGYVKTLLEFHSQNNSSAKLNNKRG